MMTLFKMCFGDSDYEPMAEVAPVLAPVFYYAFQISLRFIILNTFIAIVMRTYDNLRQERQLTTEAMA